MLGLRLLLREWRGGDLGILLAATALAVGIVTGIGMFAERLGGAINAQSSDLLGADLIVQTPRQIENDWFVRATDNLEVATGVSFPSMLSTGDNFQLAAVRAVSKTYPLRGTIRIAKSLFGDTSIVTTSPQQGEIWADARLLQGLGLDVGDKVELGDIDLTITAVLVSEPGGSTSGLAPVALMSKADLAAAGVVQVGSRVIYFYYLSGTSEALAQAQKIIEENKLPEQRVYGVKQGRPQVAEAMERAEGYLLLGGALGLVLAGAAVAIASRRYTLQQESVVAVLKTLGTKSLAVVMLYMQQLIAIGLIAIVIGWAMGWGLQALIASFVVGVMNIALPAASVKPLLTGGVTGLVCLLAFAAPPLLTLGKVSPVRVLRKELSQSVGNAATAWLCGGVALFGLMLWYTGDAVITGAVFAGLIFAAVFVGGIAWLILRTTYWAGMQAGSVWRLATSSLRRRALENSIQIVIFTITIMLFLMLLLLRTSLLDDWQQQLPEGTPNHFLVNVADEEIEPLEQWMEEKGLSHAGLYPLVRARVIQVNNFDVNDINNESDSNVNLDREINLTWSATKPDDNEITAGQWWQDDVEQDEVSVEAEFAKRLGLKLGDELLFQLADQRFSAKVTSVRELDWEQMNPNFYLMFPQHVLADLPATFITSFYLPIENKRYLLELLRQFPTMAVFEVDAIIKQVRVIVGQVSLAIEAVLWLVICCGALVLIATVRASMEERLRESAILRTLGAQTRLISGGLALEFGLLGLIAGILAAAGAELMAGLVLVNSFEMEYSPQPAIWLVGPISGALLVGLLGFIASRKAVWQPPLLVLRDLD
ncbi:MAG: putative ABC transport system permease protein [Pseudomonadales bacterium]|jgi:putative ABC transport system permease protein